MSIDVKEQANAGAVNTVDCILCGECVDACRQKALRYAMGRVRTPVKTVTRTPDVKG